MTFSRVAVIVAITAGAVYLGLNTLLPRHPKETTGETAVSAEDVFKDKAAPAAETAAGATPAPNAAAAPAAAPTQDVAATPAPAAPAAPAIDTPVLSDEEARKIAENVSNARAGHADDVAAAPAAAPAAPAAAPAPAAASADTASADHSGLSDEEARKIAENVSREVATRVAETSAAPAPAPAPAAAPSSGTGLTEADVRRIATEAAREVLREHHAKGGSAAAATAAAPAAKPKKAAKAPVETAAAAPAAAKPKSGKAAKSSAQSASGTTTVRSGSLDTITSWWPAASTQNADHLNLVYAGEAAADKAVVLLFASDMDATAASSNIRLLDFHGKTAGGAWASGDNRRMLVFKGLKPGRYTVILEPTLADAGGKALGAPLHGPVYIH